ncbi:MAG: sodium-dependent transporter [Bacteroidetes Order II. Incertae sedis bacterium]|jgi:neurotransmitter:Na+ symporter, NSS family|nr:sodium-dependent transporter [Bacteroidetes Order II. bacterium]MDG1754409.1 sodium-dependent transporter [Rhodothermales bacterium]MBT4053363.1 sodium-dependent transporter [Bacteroidetes Order II. bacterium]MBT4603573.1 sodium-dependent transporter [Bacteroidetes Order II. bacterium]MBT5250785.1 sodium-dependent transporter [Bacteroidetes Order II. bacterium]
MASASRGQWSGKTGFILAAAGSAIGLGNIWRFPYTAGENGGGAFVLLYLGFVLVVGIPVVLAELAIGRQTQKNPVGAFKALVPNTLWPYIGGLGVLTGFGILSFYAVLAGWTLSYLWGAITGVYGGVMTAEASNDLFTQLIGNPGLSIGLTGAFLLLTIVVVKGGVSKGIERTTKVLMPLLLAILVLLAIRSVTLPGGMEGLVYLFQPDFSKITGSVVMSALGQALFSLSLGMGAMITYGSYFPKEENLPQAGILVAMFDTMIALLAGIIIFPALFSVGVDPSAGPGLVFVVLPSIFGSLPAGQFFAIAFYSLLAIAALTSTISLLEVVVAYFVDEKDWNRSRAAWIIGGLCFLVAIPSALSSGGAEMFSTNFMGTGMDFLSLNNIIWGNFSLSIGALMLCLFVGWKWGIPAALASLESSGHKLAGPSLLGVAIKFICPLAVSIVLIYIIVTQQYF